MPRIRRICAQEWKREGFITKESKNTTLYKDWEFCVGVPKWGSKVTKVSQSMPKYENVFGGMLIYRPSHFLNMCSKIAFYNLR